MGFENWSKVGNTLIRSVSRLPTNNGSPIEPGEVLSVDFSGNKSTVVVKVSPTFEQMSSESQIDTWE
jgi:hypothetical protein